MNNPELAPLGEPGAGDDGGLPDLGGGLGDLGGGAELPGLGADGDPLDEAIAELQGVLEHDQAMGPLDGAGQGGQEHAGLHDLVMSLPVQVDVIIGAADIPVSDLIGMETGTVVTLNRKIGEPVDICVNGTKIATGELETLDDDPSQLAVRIVSLVQS